MLEKEIKLITNNFTKFEDAILRQRAFCPKYLINFPFWSSIDQTEIKTNNPFYIIRKRMKKAEKGLSKNDIETLMSKLVDIENLLKEQRTTIKNSKHSDDLVFAYDEILKRSIMRTRKLITILTHFI